MPVKNVKDMTDDELKKLFLDAQSHVKAVHQVEPDSPAFKQFLKMHPYYADGVDEYVRRGLDKPSDATNKGAGQEQTPEPKSSPETSTEPSKEVSSTPILEGAGEATDVEFPEMDHGLTELEKEEDAIRKVNPGITDEKIKEEEQVLQEEGISIQMGTEE